MPTNPTICPPWCRQQFCHELFPADRYHQHDVLLPVVERVSPIHGATQASSRSSALTISLCTGAAVETADDELWVTLDVGEERSGTITITVESARRLHRALGAVLAW